MRRAVIAVCAGLLVTPASGFSQTVRFELSVPGSLAGILGPGLPQQAGSRLLRDLVSIFHDQSSAAANLTDRGVFRACLTGLDSLRARWRAVERAAGAVRLRAATESEDGRRALEAFLDLFGLRLERKGSTYAVTARREEPRRICGADAGWRPDEVERRLNAGETLAWDLPHFVVSLPLSPGFWLEALYEEQVEPETRAAAVAAERAADLTGRLVTNARAAQLYLGLAALDDPTLTWLLRHPRNLLRLNDERLSMFARFAGGFRVLDGEVQVPGGAEAVAFWEQMVGAAPSDSERFMDRLFERSSGRVAQAYHMVSGLPARQQRFVLGSWHMDARDRRRGQAALQRVLEALPPPDPVFANPGAAPLADVDVAARRTPGQTICGVPPDEAIALSWDLDAMTGLATANLAFRPIVAYACSPRGCTSLGRANELFALEDVGVDITREGFRLACRVQARMQFVSDLAEKLGRRVTAFDAMQMRLPARMYRLGYKLGRDVPNVMELRELIEH